MPPVASIQNKHLKLLSSSAAAVNSGGGGQWVSVGYCEVLNGQPSFTSGSMLGVNSHAAPPPPPSASSQEHTNNNANKNGSRSSSNTTSSRNNRTAFVYGGIFDNQSLSIEKPPLPPRLAMLVDAMVAGGNGGRDSNNNASASAPPPPPPAWRCAKDTAARMDAYLANHRSDVSSQQQWLRNLKTQARLRREKGGQQEGGGGGGGVDSREAAAGEGGLLDNPRYIDLVTAQLEMKRQQLTFNAMASRSRSPQQRQQGGGGRGAALSPHERMLQMMRNKQQGQQQQHQSQAQTGAPQSAADVGPSSSSSSSSSQHHLSHSEACQLLSLADREFLMSIRNAYLHCDKVYRDTREKLRALEKEEEEEAHAASKASVADTAAHISAHEDSSNKSTTNKSARRQALLEAHQWAKAQLQALVSDGSSALWFTAAPIRPASANANGGGGGTITADEGAAAAKEMMRGGAAEEEIPPRMADVAPPPVVSLSLYNTGNSRTIHIRPRLIAAYLVANGVDLDRLVSLADKEEMGTEKEEEGPSTHNNTCSAYMRRRRHPWLWSTHDRVLQLEAYEKRRYIHPKGLTKQQQQQQQEGGGGGGVSSATGEDTTLFSSPLDTPSSSPSPSAPFISRLPSSIFGMSDKANAIFGHGSLMCFSQKFRQDCLKGYSCDHSPSNEMERRRVNMAACGRSMNNLREHTMQSSVPENAVVVDQFDLSALHRARARRSGGGGGGGGGGSLPSSSSSAASPPIPPLDFPLLSLEPPSLVTRALGLIRYKLNPTLSPSDQIIVPTPPTDDLTSVGGSTRIDLCEGEIVILCGRSVFESERSEALSYAADGATVDEIVEGVLQAILTQVEENAQALGADGSHRNLLASSRRVDCHSVDALLKAITAVDPQRLAAAVCDGGLVHGTRKSLQSMVLVVPTDAAGRCSARTNINTAVGAPAAAGGDIVSVADGFPMRRDGSFVTGSHDLPPAGQCAASSGGGDDDDSGHADGEGFTLTSSIIPSPIHATQLRSDGFYRAVFCDDLARGGSGGGGGGGGAASNDLPLITPTDYLKMRWALLRRSVLGGNATVCNTNTAAATSNNGYHRNTVQQTAIGLGEGRGASSSQPARSVPSIAAVITEDQPLLPSITHASAGRAYRNATDALGMLYPQQSAAVIRAMLYAEARVFGDGPPQRTSTFTEAEEARRRVDYFSAVGAPLFGGGGHARR